MGTEIQLKLGGIGMTYAKNHRGPDHGALFQPADRQTVRSDQIDCEYCEDEGEDPTPMEWAFVRKLRHVVPRLEMLGFTLDVARKAYSDWIVEWKDERESLQDEGDPPIPDPLSFDEFCAFANRQPIVDLDDKFLTSDDEWVDRRKPKGRFVSDIDVIERIPRGFDHDDMAWSERSYFGTCVNILHPYLMLRIFAGNGVNLDTDVLWHYGELVENGYATAEAFVPSARRRETFLIATEGSSDAHILRHGLALLRPDVADFFRFIDVSERHPFPGTGNLLKFAEGLAKIDVHNQTVFVFDNDAEGADAFGKVGTLTLPPNLRAMLLPSLECFRSFPARGPEGDNQADINGRAAAIECYLDHRLKGYPPPRVVWTNFKKEMDTYQGSLEHKESYTRAFLGLRADTLASSGYDTGNVEQLLDALIGECTAMAAEGVVALFDTPGA
ncbi:HEPN/Toprim-associated domain-containing protein [Sphingomonas sp.]|uniref:HEPN/Toprim-associated domain-containing protein n=1 Tax=Sphingomonas sp. TaxID=28214 RepID=UPI002DD68936|nr:HEPN/Toprim-associated domain-containing protein [Sphingomonas sp.]